MYNKLLLLTDLVSRVIIESNRLHSVSKDHEVETSSAIALLTFAMKENLNFQNISAHKGPVEWPTKFLIHLFIYKPHQKA